MHFTAGVHNTAQHWNKELPVKSLMDCFMYHSKHKQATKGKCVVVLYRAHFPSSAEKNEAF